MLLKDHDIQKSFRSGPVCPGTILLVALPLYLSLHQTRCVTRPLYLPLVLRPTRRTVWPRWCGTCSTLTRTARRRRTRWRRSSTSTASRSAPPPATCSSPKSKRHRRRLRRPARSRLSSVSSVNFCECPVLCSSGLVLDEVFYWRPGEVSPVYHGGHSAGIVQHLGLGAVPPPSATTCL